MEYGQRDFMKERYSFELGEQTFSTGMQDNSSNQDGNRSEWLPLPGSETLCSAGIRRRKTYRPKQKETSTGARSVWLGLPGINAEDKSNGGDTVRAAEPELGISGKAVRNPRSRMGKPGNRM